MSRLTPERLGELYGGTLQLVAEHGYDKVTMDQIAEATKSSKATLYRQWGSKSALVVEAMKCSHGKDEELPDTGTLRGDLMAMVDRIEAKETDSELIAAIMHAIRSDKDLADVVRSQIIGPGRADIRGIISRAVDRGEVAADCPALDFVEYVFVAPIVLHNLMEGEEATPAFLRRYYEQVLLPMLGVR